MPPVHRFDVDKATPEELARYLLGKEWMVALQNKYAYSDDELRRLMVSVDLDHELYQDVKADRREVKEEETDAKKPGDFGYMAAAFQDGYRDISSVTTQNTSSVWSDREDTHQRSIPDLAYAIQRGCNNIRFMNPDDAVLVYRVVESHLRYKAHEISHNIQEPPQLLLEALELLEKLAKFLHPQVLYTLNQRSELNKRKGISTPDQLAPLVPTFGFGDRNKWAAKQSTPQPHAPARTPEYVSRVAAVKGARQETTVESQEILNSDIFKDRINRW
jgi:DNA replication initiation complex subunit (GINS family)